MGLNYAIPKKFAEDTVVEENRNEYLCGILKVTEDAYDDICGCCSRINEVFGFSSVFLLLMNLLRLCVSFYSLVMVATGCESVHRTARELYRSLALFNSELQGDDADAVCTCAHQGARAGCSSCV
ncbi:hypothetical protein EVAR_97930_1 [Eumeta japonica]|uniref:Uncharacterized protein n=1 Tax=Eumeta variegata TaxID=151549 RepID=A0A4C1XW68_EUMVA|nr:hypothetical protein EVAR_97930_1 [Eumeta japonica]